MSSILVLCIRRGNLYVYSYIYMSISVKVSAIKEHWFQDIAPYALHENSTLQTVLNDLCAYSTMLFLIFKKPGHDAPYEYSPSRPVSFLK